MHVSVFLFMAEKFSIKIYHVLFMYSSADGHLACFHLLAMITNTTMNIHIQLLCEYVFNSLVYLPKSRIAGPYDLCSMFTFSRPFPL